MKTTKKITHWLVLVPILFWANTLSGQSLKNDSFSTKKSDASDLIRRPPGGGGGGGGATPPGIPPKPTASTNTCNNKTLSRSGNPPSGVIWYWQTSSSGTSTSSGGPTYSASSSGTYYLKAYGIFTNLWSAASAGLYVAVNPSPPLPSTPSVQNNCGSSRLTRGTPPSGITWYWQGKSSNGTSTFNSSSTYTANSSGTYYIRARNNSTGCWSSSRGVSVSLKNPPSKPGTPVVSSNTCGNRTLTLPSGAPHISTGIRWYWQGKNANGTSQSYPGSYTASSAGTYYLRAYNINNGCWSTSSSAYVSIHTIPPTPSTPSVQNNCGSTKLTKGNAPGGITWYWQGTSSNGTSTSNSSSTYTVTAAGTYYIRARNNSSGCWSSSRSVSASPKVIPGIPSTPTVSMDCSSSLLTRGTPPSGITWYWQGTSSNGTSTSNSSSTYTASTTGTYYLRGKNNSTSCWGSSRSVVVSFLQGPAKPGTPIASTNNCGNKTLTVSGIPHISTGIQWFWQGTNANGTSNSSSAVGGYSVSTVGTYYIRAQDTNTGCWSALSSLVYVPEINPIPAVPSTPTVQVDCGNTILTRGTPPSGITWYWQGTVSNGTSTSNSSSNYITTGAQTYYLRARDNSTGCWSSSESVAVSYLQSPAVPATPIASTNNCGNKTLTVSGMPHISTGIQWYWQGTNANGTSNSLSGASDYTISSAGTYYIRAQDMNTGCWSASSSTSVSAVNPVPEIPEGQNNSRCDEGTVTLTTTLGTHGDDILWYETPSGGSPIHTGLNYSPTLSTTTTYYVASLDSETGCESEHRLEITGFINNTLDPGHTTGSRTIYVGTDAGQLSNQIAGQIDNLTGIYGGGSYTIQWQVSSTLDGVWTDIVGATDLYYSPGILTETQYFRRSVTRCNDTQYADYEKITVIPATAIFPSLSLQEMIHRYAPQLRHSTRENYHMSSVEYYLDRAILRSREAGQYECETMANCNLRNGGINGDHKITTRSGEVSKYGHLESAKTYVHIQQAYYQHSPFYEPDIEIQFWYFYPWNGDQGGQISQHEGDWEGVKLILDSKGVLRWVATTAHGDWNYYSYDDVKYTNGQHPVVYVANESHAMYNDRGYNHPTVALLDYCDDGPAFNSWEVGNYEIVTLDDNILNHFLDGHVTNPDWLSYVGKWGETTEVFGQGSNSPVGPKFSEDGSVWTGNDEAPPENIYYTRGSGRNLITGDNTLCSGIDYTFSIPTEREIVKIEWRTPEGTSKFAVPGHVNWTSDSYTTGDTFTTGWNETSSEGGKVKADFTLQYDHYQVKYAEKYKLVWFGAPTENSYEILLEDPEIECGQLSIASLDYNKYFTPSTVIWSKTGDIASLTSSVAKATVKAELNPVYNLGSIITDVNNNCGGPIIKEYMINIPCDNDEGGSTSRSADENQEEISQVDESENGGGQSFNVYPNPTTDIVVVNLQGNQGLNDYSLEIFTLTGTLLKKVDLPLEYSNRFEIDMSSYKNGIYILNVLKDGLTFKTGRVIKE